MEIVEREYIGRDENGKYFRDKKGVITDIRGKIVNLTPTQISNLIKDMDVPVTTKEEVEE